jgi:NAD(P)-dependent dehydrogenase (short-subunit alcohol dehydrogenase family)
LNLTSDRDSTRIGLIIGASRGLGLALAEEYLKRGWRIVASVRGSARTQLHELVERSEGRLEVESVDIVKQDELTALKRRLDGRIFPLLFVNAGVTNDPKELIDEVTTEEFVRVMVTNALSPMRVIEALDEFVSQDGTIAVMSSIMGSISENEKGGWEVYRGSKAALNMFMRSYAIRHRTERRTLLAVAPGWIKTDMGGPDAYFTIAENIPRVVDVITAESGKPGLRYVEYSGRILDW